MPNAPQILPQNDKALIKAVRKGHLWSAVDELPTPEQLANPAFVAKMPTIKAATIRALCLGLWDDVIADPMGVQVVGARIVGELDLSFGTGRGPLALVHCHFAEELVIQNAHLPALNLKGSHLAKGLKGDGVHITGDLYCADGFTSKGEVRLLGAQIGGDLAFRGANLDGGMDDALSADRMVVKGSVFCSKDSTNKDFTSKGEVRLLGAQIGGSLNFRGATLDGGTSAALSADGMVVNGNLFCDHSFTSKGEVRLLGAQIGGDVSFNEANLDGGAGAALNADRMLVKGSVFCSKDSTNKDFTSKGEVRLLGAQIGGNLAFRGATLDGGTGDALSADGMVLSGDLFCDDGFTSKGTVRLPGAQIGGDVSFSGANLDGGVRVSLQNGTTGTLQNGTTVTLSDGRAATLNSGPVATLSDGTVVPLKAGANLTLQNGSIATLDGGTGAALSADRMVVTGSLFCRENFNSRGDIRLVAAKIGGVLDWRPANGNGKLDLFHATAGQWGDDWVKKGKNEDGKKKEKPTLTLDHFTYGAFLGGGTTITDSATRIDWIEASQGDDFKPGPYRTLARVLRAAGDDRGAKNVGHAMEKARTKHQATQVTLLVYIPYRGWRFLLEWGVGYGYRPWRGFIWLIILLCVGWGLFSWGSPSNYNCPPLTCWFSTSGTGIIKPADPVFITENQTRNLLYAPPSKHDFLYSLPPEYTPFNAFWYSFDTLIPLIDLGQEKAWSPSPLTAKISDDKAGWALLVYLYLHIIMGWVLSTLTLVALTGLIKRDPEGEE